MLLGNPALYFDDLARTFGDFVHVRGLQSFYFVNHPGRVYFNEGEPDNAVAEIREQRLANELRPKGRKGEEQQFVPKVSLSYSFGDDKMVYGLYTQGVRQGGVNRSRAQMVRGHPQGAATSSGDAIVALARAKVKTLT